MENHGNDYKKKPFGFANPEEKRIVRATQEKENRKGRRLAVLERYRSIGNPENSAAPNALETEQAQRGQQEVKDIQTEDRRTKLLKWRAEKEFQKKLQQQKKPPVFRTGAYDHKLNSPIFLHRVVPVKKSSPPIPRRMTRATVKRIAAKKNNAGDEKVRKTFAPQNHHFRAPKGLRPYPLHNVEFAEDQTVQFVRMLCYGEEPMPSYFTKITDNEVMRLKFHCQHWTAVKNEDDIPEYARRMISQAIGATNLLMDKKIELFRRRIMNCESGCGERLVTIQYLRGFWELLYMEVEECDSGFDKLFQLQSRNWEEEEPVAKKVVSAKKLTLAEKIMPSKSSSAKNTILAVRRKRMDAQKTENGSIAMYGKPIGEASGGSSPLSAVEFDERFFTVESPTKIRKQ